MVRRYRRTSRSVRIYRPLKTVKYSNETYSGLFDIASAQYPLDGYNVGNFSISLVKDADVAGMRKVKNVSIRLSGRSDNAAGMALVALIYVPEGFPNDSLQLNAPVNAATSMFEPNQNVIAAGTFSYENTTPVFIGNRLARNLNSNDKLILLIKPLTPLATTVGIALTANYAICFS